jgi:predicted dinucleotide-binding enzyme
LAVPYQAEKEIAEKIREVANQKVVISLNNSYNSSQEALQNLLPNSKVVKATLEEIQSIIQNNK